jgi:hypothetical protein
MIFVVGSMVSAQVNYSTQIQPIFDLHCAGCHVPAKSGWNVSSYSTVMASVGTEYGKNVVIAFNSAGSPIIDKLSNATPLHGARMPRAGGYLSDSVIAIIKEWIDEGAMETAAGTSSVAHLTADIPEQFNLSQNYPNPFNPVTHIAFSLPSARFVTVKVFDIVGRTVATLVNTMLEPGSYNVEWNGIDAASGLYFYQLRAVDPANTSHDAFISTKKLILQK